jgi:Uma2 family endonuclease
LKIIGAKKWIGTAVITDPALSDLPFKIELNEWGKIEMSPASNSHGMLQTEIAFILKKKLPSGKAFVECSIQTSKNVKVADVVWCSTDFLNRYGKSTPYPASPEIVVEVASPSNTLAELIDKRSLYFEQGAKEVWICEETGAMLFYRAMENYQIQFFAPAFRKA